jgi:hypothetical protein
MEKILETVTGREGDDVQKRILYDLVTIDTKEADTLLDFLYYYWSALQAGADDVPDILDFQVEKILQPAALEYTGWVDTESEDPRNFIIRHHRSNRLPGFDDGDGDTRLSDIPNKMHANSLILEYLRCKRWKIPLYHEIDQRIGGIRRHYTRLLLPLANGEGAVTRIFFGFRLIARVTMEPEDC